MATLVMTNGYISLAGNALSGDGTRIALDLGADAADDTAFGDTTRSRIGGLKDWSMDLEFNQDFAAGHVDAIAFPIVGTVVTVGVRPDAGARSATNPEYNGSALVVSYKPLGNQVGELAKATVRLQAAGTLSRLTS